MAPWRSLTRWPNVNLQLEAGPVHHVRGGRGCGEAQRGDRSGPISEAASRTPQPPVGTSRAPLEQGPPWSRDPLGAGTLYSGRAGAGPALLQCSPVKGIYWSQCSWQRPAANIRAAPSSSVGSHVGLMPYRTRGQGWEEQRKGLGLGVTVTTGEAPGFTVAPRGAGGDALPPTRSPKPLGWGRGRERGRGSRSAMPNPMARPG